MLARIMSQLRAQIALQMSRFLMIQNAVEKATDETSDVLSRHLVSTRLEVLEANWSKFQAEHDRLCQVHAVRLTKKSYIKHHTYERCQEFYLQAKAVLREQQETVEVSNSSPRLSNSLIPDMRSVNRRRSLPKIGLPVFSGDYHAWRSFHDLFMSMVGDNEDLTKVEKMHYLKTCLTGDAARLVTNLKVIDNTFSLAWKTLVSRYENKRVLISAQLDRLFSLKPIQSKSAQELNTMMTTVTESLGALEALSCHTNTWDPLLVHQLARLLDEDTREEWEVKLGTSTSYPTLKEFEEFVIGHARAWESLAAPSVKLANSKKRSSRISGEADIKSRSLIATAPTAKAMNPMPPISFRGEESRSTRNEDHSTYTILRSRTEEEKQRRRRKWQRQQERERQHEKLKQQKILEYERKRAQALKYAEEKSSRYSRSKSGSESPSHNRYRGRSASTASKSGSVHEKLDGSTSGTVPLFRGPQKTQINTLELRRIKVDIHRNIPVKGSVTELQRDILNPEDVIVKRRAESHWKMSFGIFIWKIYRDFVSSTFVQYFNI